MANSDADDPHEKRNPYGDKLKSSTTGFGSDVSSQRIEPFEQEMLQRAEAMRAASKSGLVALDLFAGFCAANARRLAELGFAAYAVDFSPAGDELESALAATYSSGGALRYFQQDVATFDLRQVPLIDLVSAQRGLHFLRFVDAKALVGRVVERLNAGGEMYLTIGAVDCKVGGGYKHAERNVEERWHPLEPELGEPIHVTQPLCLYKQEDIASLFPADSGSITIGRDDFGLFTVRFRKLGLL